jgi:hypothetical protein
MKPETKERIKTEFRFWGPWIAICLIIAFGWAFYDKQSEQTTLQMATLLESKHAGENQAILKELKELQQQTVKNQNYLIANRHLWNVQLDRLIESDKIASERFNTRVVELKEEIISLKKDIIGLKEELKQSQRNVENLINNAKEKR